MRDQELADLSSIPRDPAVGRRRELLRGRRGRNCYRTRRGDLDRSDGLRKPLIELHQIDHFIAVLVR
jgi:hypothetical protein